MNDMMGHNGPPETEGNWIAVSRDIREHHYVGFGNQAKRGNDKKRRCFSRAEAWLDMLMEAQYRPVRRDIVGSTIWIDVGQFLGSRSYLARRWNWSEQAVRTFLKRLAEEGMIQLGQPNDQQNNQQTAARKRASANVITICNYLKYQRLGDEIAVYLSSLETTSKPTSTSTSQQPASNQLATSQQPESNKETRKHHTHTPGDACANGKGFWQQALNPPEPKAEIVRKGDTIELTGEKLAFWRQRFRGNNEALELALIEVAGTPLNGHNVAFEAEVQRLLSYKAKDFQRDQDVIEAAKKLNQPTSTRRPTSSKPPPRSLDEAYRTSQEQKQARKED